MLQIVSPQMINKIMLISHGNAQITYMQRNISTISWSWHSCTICSMEIRIRKSLPFWSLGTNNFFRLSFMIKRVECINIILLVNSRVSCPSKFVYCLGYDSTRVSTNKLIEESRYQRRNCDHLEVFAHLSNRNWLCTHKKMNNHITSAIMAMCAMHKYIFLCPLGVKILHLENMSNKFKLQYLDSQVRNQQ